jgi:hypothetical protein
MLIASTSLYPPKAAVTEGEQRLLASYKAIFEAFCIAKELMRIEIITQ